MSREDDYDRRREETRYYERRDEQMRRRFEENRRQSSAVIKGMRTCDYRDAYRALRIPPSDYTPEVPGVVSDAGYAPGLEAPATGGESHREIEVPPLEDIVPVRANMDDLLGVPHKVLKKARKAAAREAGAHFSERFKALVRELTWLRQRELGLRLYKETYAEQLGKSTTLAERLAGGADLSDIDPPFEADYRARAEEIQARVEPLMRELRKLVGALL